MHRLFKSGRIAVLIASAWHAPAAAGGITVEDDAGRPVTLEKPAQRIISLAPHVTELLFSAGAGDRLVGVVSHSDYPPAARRIEQVGTYKQFDYERIVALRPDLIVGWQSGNPASAVAQLHKLDIPVYLSEPRTLESIATDVIRLGRLTGTADTARQAAEAFEKRAAKLRERYADKTPVTLFYEVWNDPLMTLNGEHLFSDVVRVCGGRNIFADLPALNPRIDVEAVLAADPQVVVASGMGDRRPEWLDDWKRWPGLQAVENGQLYFIPPDIIQRSSLRIIEGAERLCRQLDSARRFYAAGQGGE